MKKLDRILQKWRTRMISPYIKHGSSILDIGSYDGAIFKDLSSKNLNLSYGIDPLIENDIITSKYKIIKGFFPNDLPIGLKVDTITFLAVIEHLPPNIHSQLNTFCRETLNKGGNICITVPSPKVDYVLKVLIALKLVDASTFDEHYGFQVDDCYDFFDKKDFRLVTHKKFQLGLNNLFVFERVK